MKDNLIFRSIDRFHVMSGEDQHPGIRGLILDGHLGCQFLTLDKKYSGMGISELHKMKLLEEEGLQLKKLVANHRLDTLFRKDKL